jgi:phage terminase large subunit-like protein
LKAARCSGVILVVIVSSPLPSDRAVDGIPDDPATTLGDDADETGIVVVGKDHQGHGYVLADA